MTSSYTLGIDLHKSFGYWTLLNADRHAVWQGKVATAHAAVVDALAALPVPTTQCAAALEPVSQWGWYADLLADHGVQVYLANPLEVRLIAKNRLKHDKVDSRILADLLQADYLPTAYLAPREARDLRELIRTRVTLVRVRTQLKNRIHSILAQHGMSCPFADLFGKKGRVWLEAQTLRPVYQAERISLLTVMDALDHEIAAATKEIAARAVADEDAKILMTLPGFGPFTALLVKAEVGSFDRFPTPDRLASYAGLVSSSYSSGDHVRLGRITKQGSRLLRWALVQAAQRVNPSWGTLWSFAQRIRAKKGFKIARVALARKLLVTAWHLMKKREPFQALPQGSFGGVAR